LLHIGHFLGGLGLLGWRRKRKAQAGLQNRCPALCLVQCRKYIKTKMPSMKTMMAIVSKEDRVLYSC